MTEPAIDTGEILEALNDKADRDLHNTQPVVGDYVVEWQTPTSSNNYTWYRLYKSGWVEQGGYTTGNASYGKKTINLPIEMADVYYHTSCTIRWGSESSWYTGTGGVSACGLTDIAGPVADVTTTSFSIQTFSNHVWEVKGMSAQS